MADISHLEEERRKRAIKQLMEEQKFLTTLPLNTVDLSKLGDNIWFGTILSPEGGPNLLDMLTVTMYDMTGEQPRPLGAIRLTEAQWTKFVQAGNHMLDLFEPSDP